MRRSLLIFISFIVATSGYSEFLASKEEQKIRKQSSIWNSAFIKRETNTVVHILSPDVQMTSAGGKWQGHEGTEKFLKGLFKTRPDITWVNEPAKIEINPIWKVAYETGRWIESWTEHDGKTEIRGTYFAMWKKKDRKEDGPWLLHAVIFTPLSCIGESQYCK